MMRPFLYAGYTEFWRFGLGIEFILESPKYGVMITILWWFIVVGVEKK